MDFKLISELLRGEWLLDVNNVHSYHNIIKNLLDRQDLDFKSNYDIVTTAMSILDSHGQPVRSKDGDPVEVPQGSIAMVDMTGEIMKYGGWCTNGAVDVVAELYKADSLQNVDATIFHIDGPGGSTKAIGPFRDFARNKTKPVVGILDDALSLHYWAAVECCDYLIADNDVSARYGSVGIVASWYDDSEALKAMGINYVELYPDESKDKNLPYILARQGKYDLIKTEYLKPLALKFQGSVKDNRPGLIAKEGSGVLTGKAFYADEALSLGMIDEIGNMNTAFDKAKELARGNFRNQIQSLI